jgi:hypothetical protein
MTDIKQKNLKKLAKKLEKNQGIDMANGLIIDGKSGKVEIKFIDNGRQDYEFTVPAPDLLLDFMIGLLLEGKKAFGDDFTSLYNIDFSVTEEQE